MIIIEGPDGAGKSTLADYLSRMLPRKLVHYNGTKLSADKVNSILYSRNKHYHLFDRIPLVGSFVYGDIFGEKVNTNDALERLKVLCLEINKHKNSAFIFCKSKDLFLEEKPHKDLTKLNRLSINANKIIGRYLFIEKFIQNNCKKTLFFDRSTMKPSKFPEILSKVKILLGEI